MLCATKDLEGYAIGAIEGTTGRFTDFHFDDQAWVVRYLAVDTDLPVSRYPLDDPHPQSCKTIIGYHIEANDGGIGHLRNLLVDEEGGAIRYVAVDPGNWSPGHDVIASQRTKLRSDAGTGRTSGRVGRERRWRIGDVSHGRGFAMRGSFTGLSAWLAQRISAVY
ncbi:MAG TPA: PRC-barrel domain-containing protein, partial [Gemmatimonadaceae bacterium]|nr:PRC-barrel domain-containing protein [Gemmatimonadaceae bacterium]